MGVYIKGVEKPKSCGECFIGRRFMCEHVETFEDCPMVEVPEPHGRLIDADRLAADLDFDAMNFEEDHEMKSNAASWLRSNQNHTLIEAEENNWR